MTDGLDALSYLRGINRIAEARARGQEKDGRERFIGSDGFYHCSACGRPLQSRIRLGGSEMVVWICCDCDVAERRRTEEEIKRQERERARRRCFSGSVQLMRSTFDADDSPGSLLSRAARAYADKFSEASDWLLLCGGTGTGKTFFAAAVCNALIDRGVSAKLITVPQLINCLWDSGEKKEFLRSLDGYSLLVIDDLGAERRTEYSREIVFGVVEGRLRAGKPCIVTTNIRPAEITSQDNGVMGRIYSRVLERSVPLVTGGGDRRVRSALENGAERLRRLISEQHAPSS